MLSLPHRQKRDVSNNKVMRPSHSRHASLKRIAQANRNSSLHLCLLIIFVGFCSSANTVPIENCELFWFSGGNCETTTTTMRTTVNRHHGMAQGVTHILLLMSLGVTNTTSFLVPKPATSQSVIITKSNNEDILPISSVSASFSKTFSVLNAHGGDYGTPAGEPTSVDDLSSSILIESDTRNKMLSSRRRRRKSTKLSSTASAVSNTSIRRQRRNASPSSSSLRSSSVYEYIDSNSIAEVVLPSTIAGSPDAAAGATAVTRIGRHGGSSIAANEVAPPLPVEDVMDGETSSWYSDQQNLAASPVEGMMNWIQNPSLNVARGLVVVASAIYGTNFALIKILDHEMPLSVSAVLRFSLAAAVVSGIVLGREIQQDRNQQLLFDKEQASTYTDDATVNYKPDVKLLEEERWSGLLAGAEIGLFYCVGYIFQAEALSTIEAGKSAFFNGLAVVIVPLLDAAFRGRILTPQVTLSVVLACAGVALMNLDPTAIMGDGGGGGSLLTFSTGDFQALAQTLFFGIGYWRLEALSQRNKTQASRLTVGQLVAVAIGAILYSFFRGGGDVVASDAIQHHWPMMMDQWSVWLSNPVVLGAILWTGLISTALALYLETVALKVVSATELTLIMTSVSLFGAAFAWVTLGEVLSNVGMLGGALILGGCILGSLPSSSGHLPSEVPAIDAEISDGDTVLAAVGDDSQVSTTAP